MPPWRRAAPAIATLIAVREYLMPSASPEHVLRPARQLVGSQPSTAGSPFGAQCRGRGARRGLRWRTTVGQIERDTREQRPAENVAEGDRDLIPEPPIDQGDVRAE